MKPGKLYLKIFFSFLVVLIVTEALIFALFLAYVGRPLKERIEEYSGAKVSMLRQINEEIIEERIRSNSETSISQNESVKHFIQRFGETFGAKIWLNSSNGEVLVRSFDGPVPTELIEEIAEAHSVDLGEFKAYHVKHKGSGLYAIVPIGMLGGERGELHILFDKVAPPHPDRGFGWGLVLIGVVIAILVIPISRYITRPLKELTHTAMQITAGNLSHRASVRSRGEIGELGQAFNRMAERIEHMIRGGKELTANISHQLRSPLARIRVAEELLQEQLDRENPGDLRRHLNDIREDVEEMDRLIGRILALSKLDIHDAALKPEALNPADIVRELLERLKPVMDQKGLRLEANLSSEFPFFADREELVTVFSNLLDNACKYTPEKGTVSVTMASKEDGLHFVLTNASRPLSGEQIERIFDPFYRVEGSPSRGSGLGLAITRKIVQKQGGTITASQSAEEFRIALVLPSI